MTAERLEYLRGELRGGTISYGELAELAGLANEIEPDDVELLEAAGVPEFPTRSHAWADSFGVWHARVEITGTGNDARAAMFARALVRDELAARQAAEPTFLLCLDQRVSYGDTLTYYYTEIAERS